MTRTARSSGVEGRRAPSAAVLRTKVRLQDLRIEGRRVLVRVDFNVPVQGGQVTDESRILGTLPTLRHLLRNGAAVVAMAHRGRPGGAPDPEASMGPVADSLRHHLGQVVSVAADCVGEEVERQAKALAPGELLLLENLRFHPGETANDPEFAARLARLGEMFVNDAFGVCHRQHASIVAVARALQPAAAGDLLQREVTTISRVLVQPAAPFVLVLGGAKVTDKVAVIGNLLPLIDRMVVGGAMANAFLAAGGRAIGQSLAPEDAIQKAREILERAAAAGVEVVLPSDLIAAPSIDRPDAAHVVTDVPDDEMALDIGPQSRERFADALAGARTVVWNGPMGVFEQRAFAAGSHAVAESIARLRPDALTVIGGGDTAAAAAAAGVTGRVSHVSTGGGASLDLLSGAILPGIAALTDRTTAC